MTPLLHAVAVVGLGFAPPALAAPPSTPDVDVAWSGDTLLVRASGPEPSVVAVAFLLRTVRGVSVDAPLAPWERAQASRAIDRGQVPVSRVDEGPVSIALTATALAGVKASWGRTVRWHDRIPLAMSPDGPVVLQTPGDDLPLQAGDVLQAIGGQRVTTVDDIDRYSAFSSLEVLRDGAVQRLASVVPVGLPLEPDWRTIAPTCGPCCHGHCGDDMKPIPFPSDL